MRKRNVIRFAAVVLASSYVALAAAETLRLQHAPQASLFVWRSADAYHAGMKLIRGGADARLVLPYIACSVDAGTKIVVLDTDPGWFLREVIVTVGPAQGCRGIVPREWVVR